MNLSTDFKGMNATFMSNPEPTRVLKETGQQKRGLLVVLT